MNHWPFIIGAYGVTVSFTSALILWTWMSMRNAERRADQLKRQ